jgi:dihydroflavonol-4-reductase
VESAELVRHAVARTRRILRAARRHRVPVVHVSSFGTLPQRRNGMDRLATGAMQQLHPYFAVKNATESTMLEAARLGQPIVVVNPTGCLGPWDSKARERCFVPALLRREIPAATDQMLNVIDVRDVAIGLVNAMEREIYGEPIALVGHNISNEVLFRWICEFGDVRPPPLTTPSGAAVVTTYFSELALGAVGLKPPLPALVAMLTYMHGYLTPSPRQTELGLVLRPLSRTLLETIDWYRAIGYC